ncbi:MAG: hypothetical protein II551_06595 [Paludibacteraceae bacterium]|nr:hypothetical protein [Paludibacteraceae bacterium]
MKRIVWFILPVVLLLAAMPSRAAEHVRGRIPQSYLDFSGNSSLTIVNLGYTYSFPSNMHILEAGILAFRYTWFGMSPLNFEMGLVKNDEGKTGTSGWVGYKPLFHLYAPIYRSISLSPYFGASIDCSGMGKYLVKGYEYNKDNNFFVDVIGGLSVYMTFIPEVPFEVRAEYRYPAIQNQKDPMLQGFYLSARVHFAKPFGQRL